ncbi:MAG TPA: ABC transporter permease [Vicinamibacterales bacterium]|nr:ABC transporter permease [Vicinamibacterales bacterium]
MLDQLTKDLIYSARGLARERSFTATTVATLTVGLALVTVVFAVFNAYVLRPYAVRNPYSLYEIRWSARQGSAGSAGRTFRWADYQQLKGRTDLFDDVLGERNQSVLLDSRPVLVAFVTGNYFHMLGGRVLAGRALADFDARLDGADPVAVLSHNAWTRVYGGDPAIVGRTIRLNTQVVTIVGVMQEEFLGLNDTPPDMWVPVTMYGAVLKQDLFGSKQPRELAVIARLRTGVTADQVVAALSPDMVNLSDRQGTVRAEVLPQATPAPLTPGLLARLSPVFAAFALVLIAACANVSNVMLARANTRQREIGIRLALGAGRGRVVRQLFIEGLLIAAIAGAMALGVASLVLRAGLAIFFMSLPPSFAAIARVLPLSVDHRVFLFTLVVAGLATIIFALLPALHGTRLTLTSALRGELSSGVRGSMLRHALVISQVAVSLVLIIVAATLVRNGRVVQDTDVGFETHSLVSITPRGATAKPDAFKRAYETLASSPHVAQITATSHNPLTGELPMSPIRMPDGRSMVPVSYMYVSPEYFLTLQIALERGRAFAADEARSESKVAIVSAAAARALWPDTDPMGKTVRVWMPPEDRPDVITHDRLVSTTQIDKEGDDMVVIGIAKDVVNGLVYDGRRPHIYLPTSPGARHAKALLVRGRSVADIRQDVLQSMLQSVDSNPLAFSIVSLDEALALQRYPMMIASWIGLLLSAIALALSVSGLYGVVTYGVSQRVKEIGIRIALGATPAAIVRLVMMQAGRLVAIGSGVGLLVSFSVLGVLAAIVPLQNVSILNPAAFTAGTAIVGLSAALAALLPSRAATRIDPSHSLRSDQ